MRLPTVLTAAVLVACLAVTSLGQCPGSLSLLTTLAAGNAHRGNMFDIVCTDPSGVLITGFEGSWTGTTNLEIYAVTGGGSITGNETSGANWTLIGSASNVAGGGIGVATPIPIPVSVFIPNGGTQGFYVTSSNIAVSLNYSNGTSVGAVWASDASIQFLEGCGGEYPFQCTFVPRIWNGYICYTVGGTPPAQDYQTNVASASLKVDNTAVGAYTPTIVTKTVEVDSLGALITPATGSVNLSSQGNPSSFFDIFLSSGNVVPLSGAGLEVPVTAPPGTGEIVNLPIFSAGFISLNSGNPLDVSLQPIPGANLPGSTGGGIGIPYQFDDTNSPTSFSLQAAVTEVASPNGFRMTGATQMDVNLVTLYPPYSTCPSTVGGDLSPLSDDGAVAVNFLGSFTYYGVAYSSCQVNMNGNLTFNAADTDFTATEAEFLSGNPKIAPAWDDWTPSDPLQGTVRTSDDGVTFSCEWFDVRAFACAGGAGDTNTFCATLDNTTGFITFDYGQMTSCAAYNILAGISPGGGLSLANNVDMWDATNMVPFSNGPTVGATDAIYQAFGASGAGGVFDLQGPQQYPGYQVLFAGTGGVGVGPYLQN